MITADELMTVTASRMLADHRVVFAGIGLPLVASALAKSRRAPNLTIVLEGGIVGLRLRPGQLPDSTNEMCAAVDADMITGICDVFLAAQRGYFDYGFLGCAQIDRQEKSPVGRQHQNPAERTIKPYLEALTAENGPEVLPLGRIPADCLRIVRKKQLRKRTPSTHNRRSQTFTLDFFPFDPNNSDINVVVPITDIESFDPFRCGRQKFDALLPKIRQH